MKNLVITISGLTGCGSTITATILAEKLHTDFFSPGKLFKDIASGKVAQQKYFSLFEKICKTYNITIPQSTSKNDSQGTISLWETDFGKSPQLHKAIDELQKKLAEKGNIVIDGKLSLLAIKNADVKVWLKAKDETRAQRIAKRDGISILESKKIMQIRKEKEKKEWEKIYGVDYTKLENHADIIIDTTKKTPNEVVDIIVKHITNTIKY